MLQALFQHSFIGQGSQSMSERHPLSHRKKNAHLPASLLCLPIQPAAPPLSPKPELEEVQKGTTVFPVKSFAFTKLSTGHAAIPHHIA